MATYTSFSELKDKQLKYGDIVQFTINGEKLNYFVYLCYLVDTKRISNACIFEKLGISDKDEYASRIYGYTAVGGAWPEFQENDYKAATKLVCDLFKKCEGIIKGSIYKVGDKVRVKDHYDLGCNGGDYPYSFTKEMLKRYGDKEVTITKVCPTLCISDYKLYRENYKYHIAEDGETHDWSAAMFAGKTDKVMSTKEELPANVEESVEHCKRDISDAHYSSRTSHNYIEIPCSYEEVTLSIKKKKVHF